MKTARSMVDTFLDCPRMRFNQYHYDQTGLVPIGRSIPLATGIHVHRGVAELLTDLMENKSPDVEQAVGVAVGVYTGELANRGFRGKGATTDAQQEFTFREQCALIEGLIRAWAMREMPRIIGRYKVLAVEREIEPLQLGGDVAFMARPDAELQEIDSGDQIVYSLKTAAMWNAKSEASYRLDLQGITEIWAVEEDARIANQQLVYIKQLAEAKDLVYRRKDLNKNLTSIARFMTSQMREKNIMGVRYCILIKGKRLKPDYAPEDAMYVTYSPLIRGYKNITQDGINYAHSYVYPNHENKSGTSRLGKGWAPFNVWEQKDMTVKSWLEFLDKQECQPECGDIIGAQIVNPLDYFRDQLEIREGMNEVRLQEQRIAMALEDYNNAEGDELVREEILATVFPHHRKSCQFMYGDICEYVPLCWDATTKADPLNNGYERRIPHHTTENGDKTNGKQE